MTAKINVPIDDRTMTRKTILLVEDNRDDEELTLRALRKSNIMNDVVVARDGAEALDLLFGGSKYIEHETDMLPAVCMFLGSLFWTFVFSSLLKRFGNRI